MINKRLNSSRRKAPLFRLKAQLGIDYKQLVDNNEIKEAIINETVVAINDGIKKNKKIISLFEIADSNCYIKLERNKWKSTLENVIQYYINNENYDMCITCRDLINKL